MSTIVAPASVPAGLNAPPEYWVNGIPREMADVCDDTSVRYALHGVHVSASGRGDITACATDTAHLVAITGLPGNLPPVPGDVIIHAKAIPSGKRTKKDRLPDVWFNWDKWLRSIGNRLGKVLHIIEGNYPRWRAVLPWMVRAEGDTLRVNFAGNPACESRPQNEETYSLMLVDPQKLAAVLAAVGTQCHSPNSVYLMMPHSPDCPLYVCGGDDLNAFGVVCPLSFAIEKKGESVADSRRKALAEYAGLIGKIIRRVCS